MATNNRGGNRGGSNRGRRGQNNNPEGRNQYSGMLRSAAEKSAILASALERAGED